MLSAEDVKTLSRPFPQEAHEFTQGFVYITEDAICNRIEEVDPNWQLEIRRMGKSGVNAICVVRMTIKGIWKDGVGMQKINERAGEAEKGAATDALKRAARLFGIGRYLLGAPKESEFARWLKTQSSGTADNADPSHWASNEIERAKVTKALKELGFNTASEISKALNRVDRRISDQPTNMRLSQTKFGSADELVNALKRAFAKRRPEGEEEPMEELQTQQEDF